MLAIRAHSKGLELAYHIPESVPDALLGDPGRLRQIVVNLLGNAIKFTAQGDVVMRVQVEWQTESSVLAPAMIMMLTSASQPRDAARCRELGLASYLTKPISPSDLLQALCSVLHLASGAEPDPSLVQPAPVQSQQALHILLVEDNPINQRLTVWMLEKWGHTVVVGNGKEALAALAREAFALVLLDVQMSEMDGFATTAAIRQQEQATGNHIPIVVVTADAMAGDRERCLRAGMDAYLTKPLQARQLFHVIERILPSPAPAPETEQVAKPCAAVFDPRAALSRVRGDREMLLDIVRLFFDEIPELLSTLHTSIARGDGRAIERMAIR